jgi:hypothetical protein
MHGYRGCDEQKETKEAKTLNAEHRTPNVEGRLYFTHSHARTVSIVSAIKGASDFNDLTSALAGARLLLTPSGISGGIAA